MKKNGKNICLLLILLAFVLRFANINRHEYWFDERASTYVASQPLPVLLELARRDTHPPLYFLLLKPWLNFSRDSFFPRLLSVFLGTLTVGLTYLIAEKIFSRQTAILTGLFMAFSPFHVYYSAEIRMYALFLSETVLLTWLLLKRGIKRNRLTTGMALLIETALLYTHYYALFVLSGLSIWTFIHKPQLAKWLFKVHVLSLVIFIPWLAYSFDQTKPDCWCFPPVIGIPMYIVSLTTGGLGLVTLKDFRLYLSAPVLSLFVLTSLLFFGFSLIGIRRKLLSLPSLMFFVPLGFASTASLFTLSFSPRALITGLPFYFMLVAQGVLNQHPVMKKVSLTVLSFLLAIVLLIQMIDPFFAQIPPGKNYLLNGGLPASLWEK